jgi:type I restriction-modification system DNA methylase subunit
MYNLLRKINPILKTITYEYVYKGTHKKSLSKYLTKADIEKVLGNIEAYKNKTITIETTAPKIERNKKLKEERISIKITRKNFVATFGERKTQELFNLAIQWKAKIKELTEKEKEAKEHIRKINNAMAVYENNAKAEIKKTEKIIYSTLGIAIKGFN